jgi:hypothetical protein
MKKFNKNKIIKKIICRHILAYRIKAQKSWPGLLEIDEEKQKISDELKKLIYEKLFYENFRVQLLQMKIKKNLIAELTK